MAATDLYVPIDLAGRLVTAARNHLERQSRYLDPAAPPVELLDEWVAQLERARVSPSPIPEPGDVLVKQDRGEQWYLGRDGWRELAPVEWQRADADRLVDAPTEERIAADRAVEDLHGTVAAAGPPWPLFVQDVLDDLAERTGTLRAAAAVLTDAEAVAERDLLDSIRAFADGLDDARKLLLDAATEAARR